MSNRADDLETQVAELQAAVDGLTEELVETKERVRQLEETTDDLEADAGESAPATQSESAVESRTTAEEQAKARGTDERRDAEFVANEEAGEPDESPVEAEADGEDDSDDDGDDIIVA